MIITTTSSFCENSPLIDPVVAHAVKTIVDDLHAPTENLLGVAEAMIQDFRLGLVHDYAAEPLGPDGETERSRMPLMMLPTHVDRTPTGKENGTFVAIDLGGTNLRVCAITLISDGNPNPITTDEEIAEAEAAAAAVAAQGGPPLVSTIHGLNHRCVQAHYRIPEELKTGTLAALAGFIADAIRSFLFEHNKAFRCDKSGGTAGVRPLIPAQYSTADFEEGPMPSSLGFTFSFPVKQHSLKKSSLITWTKGFSIPDGINQDIAAAVQGFLDEHKLNIKINALINDTVGTLLAHAYDNPKTVIGVILGTGTNAAFIERRGNITKVPLAEGEDPNSMMIINTEWGAFNKVFDYIKRTRADYEIDMHSLNPGHHLFEKMISGLYLGEVLAKSLVVLMDDKDVDLFANLPGAQVLRSSTTIPTRFMQWVEAKDEADRPTEARRIFQEHMGMEEISVRDSLIFCEVLTAVRRRAARLAAAAIYAMLRQMELPRGEPVAVAIDGTLWLKYPNFKNTVLLTLTELLTPAQMQYVTLENARDGSGMGAAVVAALYADQA